MAAFLRAPEAARQAAWQELAAARAELEAHHQQQQAKRQRIEGEGGGAGAAPCTLKKDTDWSENGEIIVKEQVQSEYWHLKH